MLNNSCTILLCDVFLSLCTEFIKIGRYFADLQRLIDLQDGGVSHLEKWP
jgi:hypothetical protein